MKRYDSYKDSGIEWIGEIPSHWEVKRLKRLARIGNGQDHKNVWDENGEYPIIGTGGEFGRANAYLHTGPSVVLGRKGTIDKPQFIKTPFWSVDTAYYTDIKSNINPRLFYYLCTTINFELHKYGSAVPSMTQEVLNQIPFVIPDSIQEQTAIASYLDRKTAEIDELIADKKRLLELYEEEKTAIINQAVTKGINPDVPMKDSGIEWLGEIPEHWEVKRLKYVASINDEVLTENTEEDLEIEYVEISGVKSGIGIVETSNYKFKDAPSRARRKVRDGDVLVSTVRTYLKSIAKVDNPPQNLVASTGFAVIRPNKINSEYTGFLFYSEPLIGKIISLSTGVSYPAINSCQIGEIKIPIPPKEEQIAISKIIENHVTKIGQQKIKTEKLIALLTEYRTALISEVVTGKVKVID